MPDLIISLTAGPLSKTITIPEDVVAEIRPAVDMFWAYLDPDGNDLEQFAAGLRHEIVELKWRYDRAQAKLRRGDWTPPNIEEPTE